LEGLALLRELLGAGRVGLTAVSDFVAGPAATFAGWLVEGGGGGGGGALKLNGVVDADGPDWSTPPRKAGSIMSRSMSAPDFFVAEPILGGWLEDRGVLKLNTD
jgi:hypothetical protein